jgi:DNA repair exonuclease SbcCD ATPase subunit
MENTQDMSLVNKVLELTEELNSSKTNVESLNREIGTLENSIGTLQERIEELKSKQPEVRIVEQKEDRYGFKPTNVIEYRNLDSVKIDIEKATDKKYKSDIEKLEKELKEAKSTIEDYNTRVERLRKDYESKEANNRQSYTLRGEELERDYKERATKKDLKIKELQEEITKVKEDKTDEQLEKLRTEEIATLKLQIKELKDQRDEFIGMNIFKRIWLALTNQAVRVAAEKKIQEKEQELRKNRDEQERLNRTKRSNDYNWFTVPNIRW